MEELKVSSEKSEKISCSKTVKVGTTEKTMRVKEVENGFIITIDKSWRDEKDCYQYDCKEYISKENPMEELMKSDDGTDDKEPDFSTMLASLKF